MIEFKDRRALYIYMLFNVRGGWRGRAIGSVRSHLKLIAELGTFRRACHESQARVRRVGSAM